MMKPRILVPVLLAAVAAGCGFHLQGHEPLPKSLAVVRIDPVDTQSDFYYDLRSALQAAGTRVVDDGDGSSGNSDAGVAVIHILADSTAQRTLTVSTLNIPTEYELTYTIRVSVDAGGHALMAPQDYSLVRDYSFNESELLAKEREREVLTTALARELVSVMMRRLESL